MAEALNRAMLCRNHSVNHEGHHDQRHRAAVRRQPPARADEAALNSTS